MVTVKVVTGLDAGCFGIISTSNPTGYAVAPLGAKVFASKRLVRGRALFG